VKQESAKNETGNEQDCPEVYDGIFGGRKDYATDPADSAERDHQQSCG
jgi:hypothetical protein